MKPHRKDSNALDDLRGEVFAPSGGYRTLEDRIMEQYENHRPTHSLRRWAVPAAATLVLGSGVAFATGLDEVLSGWIATVEAVDEDTDRVTLEHTEDPDLGFTTELPNADTPALLEAAQADEIHAFEVDGDLGTLFVAPATEAAGPDGEMEILLPDGGLKTVRLPEGG